jgi:D-glycero-D-manno-heptose 1,7-bisphosphate phosphatase
MCEDFKPQDVDIDKVYFCPFHPEHCVGRYKIDSPCHKPAPGMINQAAQEFDVDIAKSVLVGDKESDIQAGVASGIGYSLLYRPSGSKDKVETVATAVVNSFTKVNKFLHAIK